MVYFDLAKVRCGEKEIQYLECLCIKARDEFAGKRLR